MRTEDGGLIATEAGTAAEAPEGLPGVYLWENMQCFLWPLCQS